MKISLTQIHLNSGEVEKNLTKIEEFICKSQEKNSTQEPIQWIVFPEMCDTGYEMPVILKNASTWEQGNLSDGKSVVSRLSGYAKKYRVGLIVGVSERTVEGVYNALVVIDSSGQIIGKHRKTHLITAAPIHEDRYLLAGDQLNSIHLNDWCVGLMTCYELRFPEIARTLSLQGAKCLIIPAAWPASRIKHWEKLLVARAIENQVYIIAVNRLGQDGGIAFGGSSQIIHPNGEILQSLDTVSEGCCTEILQIRAIEEVRQLIHIYQDRKPHLYKL